MINKINKVFLTLKHLTSLMFKKKEMQQLIEILNYNLNNLIKFLKRMRKFIILVHNINTKFKVQKIRCLKNICLD